jgi:hypothetical protein
MNETAVTVERADAHEWSDEQMEDLFSNGFPPFIIADRLAKQYIGRVREWFPEWDLILVDAQQNPAATGWGIPVHWDGTVAGLPTGYTDATIRAVEGLEQGIATDTLVICGAVVAGRLMGRGLAGKMLAALRDTALEAGLTGAKRAPHQPRGGPGYLRRTEHLDPPPLSGSK